MVLFAKIFGGIGILIPVALLLTQTGVGSDTKSIWFLSVIGLSVYGFGHFASHNSWRFGLVMLSIFLGGGAQLWLTQPLWYPALILASNTLEALMVALIALQAGIAIWILVERLSVAAIRRSLQALGSMRLLMFLILSVAFSLSLMGFVARSAYTSYVAHLGYRQVDGLSSRS